MTWDKDTATKLRSMLGYMSDGAIAQHLDIDETKVAKARCRRIGKGTGKGQHKAENPSYCRDDIEREADDRERKIIGSNRLLAAMQLSFEQQAGRMGVSTETAKAVLMYGSSKALYRQGLSVMRRLAA